MLLSVSRLMFAWAEDGIFSTKVAQIDPKRKTPIRAIIISGIMASIGILGSHFAGDFFLGIDIMVTAMLVNFLLMCLTVLTIHRYNPKLAQQINVFKQRSIQLLLAGSGVLFLTIFLVMHTLKDLRAKVDAWYFHSTWVWLLVMGLASLIFLRKIQQLKRAGIDVKKRFQELPPN